MSKYNIKKARDFYKRAKQERFIEEILSLEIDKTTDELLTEMEDKYGIKPSHIEKLLGYSKGTLSKWRKENARPEILFWVLKGVRRYYYTFHTILRLGLDEDGADDIDNDFYI